MHDFRSFYFSNSALFTEINGAVQLYVVTEAEDGVVYFEDGGMNHEPRHARDL